MGAGKESNILVSNCVPFRNKRRGPNVKSHLPRAPQVRLNY